MIRKDWIVLCDECFNKLFSKMHTKNDAIWEFKQKGWKIQSPNDLCPECVEEEDSSQTIKSNSTNKNHV
jgi:hypothetical protein